MSEYKRTSKKRSTTSSSKKRRKTNSSSSNKAVVRKKKTSSNSRNIARKKAEKKKLKRKINHKLIIIGVLIVIAILGVITFNDAKKLKTKASLMKEQLKTAVQCLKDEDTEGSTIAMNSVVAINDELKSTMDLPLWVCARFIPFVGGQVSDVRELLNVMDTASNELIYPAIDQMAQYPTSQLKVGDGQINATMVSSWLHFADDKMPAIYEIANSIGDMNLSLVDSDGKIAEYQDTLNSISTQYEDLVGYIKVIENIVGDGQTDKFYVFMAQNSSELRASGGFPGSIGSIEISDGVMTIGNFTSVYNVMSASEPYGANLTKDELTYFSSSMSYSMDAGFCPDFKRVGEITALSYEQTNGVNVDGVISMTPAIIQKILALTGEITLSDGTVMNGDNATYELQYGIYYRYYFNGADSTAYDADDLFAETAKGAMSAFTSNFSLSNIMNYFKLFSEGVDEKIIQIYMCDDAEEQVVIDAGCGSVLNDGTNNAKAGVYISVYDASKLGWWVTLDTSCGEGVKNADGTTSYDVTVTLDNTITNREIDNAGEYIIGSNDGMIWTYLHLFAPTGGSISNVSTSNGMDMDIGEYEGREFAYSLRCYLYPDTPITITYTLTVASDVSDPLTFDKTPTLQDYH